MKRTNRRGKESPTPLHGSLSSSYSRLVTLSLCLLISASLTTGCRRTAPSPAMAEKGLPPAYTRNQITDPALRKVAEAIQTWALQQTGDGGQPLYGRVEVLPPVQTVQPYGIGVFQQEPRLPIILTTGAGWASLEIAAKEAKTAQAFHDFSERLQALKRETPLQPTLTIQSPQGMELAWVNRLVPNGKNVHGDE